MSCGHPLILVVNNFISLTKLIVSHDLLRSTVTNQIAFYQGDSKSVSIFECTMDCCCQALVSKLETFRPVHTIRFQGSNSWFRKLEAGVQMVRFQGSVFAVRLSEFLFVVCSHNPIFRTNKESSIWRQNDHRDIIQNLSAPFIFQEECRKKIEHVLFPSVFSKLQIRALEGHFHCVHTIQFSVQTKIGCLKRIV